MRGDWTALEILPKAENVRTAVEQAKLYDSAMNAYSGFIASRRNYDIGQGRDVHGFWQSGVFESSWRAGGASPAELLAMSRFMEDPDLQVAAVSHVEKFGHVSELPTGAEVHFQGEDPQLGRLLRYTIVTGAQRRSAQH